MTLSYEEVMLSGMTHATLGKYLHSLTKYTIFYNVYDESLHDHEFSPAEDNIYMVLCRAYNIWNSTTDTDQSYVRILKYLNDIHDACQWHLKVACLRKFNLCVQFLEKSFPRTPPNEEEPSRPQTPVRSLLTHLSFLS